MSLPNPNDQSNLDIMTCDFSSLVNLKDINIDTSLSSMQRMHSFISQIKNPYIFRVDDVIVKVNYSNKIDIHDALASAFLIE